MKRFLVLILALMLLLSVAACGEKTQPDAETDANGQASEDTAPEESASPEDDPAEYSMSYWEEKYPGRSIFPFTIDENGVEQSYYWVSGVDCWDGTMLNWLDLPFNWNGWHKTADGCIVNKDETLKLTDDWAGGEESLSSFCTVTTEKYR